MRNYKDIKFRVFDKSTGKFWVNPTFLVNGIDEMFCGDIKDLVFMQYTGLKDKDDKEIIEGDLLELYSWDEEGDTVTRIVVFQEGCFMVEDLDKSGICSIQMVGLEDCAVVGNIFSDFIPKNNDDKTDEMDLFFEILDYSQRENYDKVRKTYKDDWENETDFLYYFIEDYSQNNNIDSFIERGEFKENKELIKILLDYVSIFDICEELNISEDRFRELLSNLKGKINV